MLTIKQLVDAAIKAKRGLTLRTSSIRKADAISEAIRTGYVRAMPLQRFAWGIDGVVIRIQVGHLIPESYNVWHV